MTKLFISKTSSVLHTTLNLYSISLLVLFKGYWLGNNWNYDNMTVKLPLSFIERSCLSLKRSKKIKARVWLFVNVAPDKCKGPTLMTAGISGSFPFFFQRQSSKKAVEGPAELPVLAVSLQLHSMRQKGWVQHPKQTHDLLSSAQPSVQSQKFLTPNFSVWDQKNTASK